MDRKSLRPQITTILKKEHISEIEVFQNETLRPIIKMQHTILIEFYKAYIAKIAGSKSESKILDHIESSITKDVMLKHIFIGMIIGQFTEEELIYYTEQQSELKKRISAIIKQRLKDSIEELI
jgi:hypothetical protein